ncbi:uncharacterized protein DS421_12g361290 [Arachis hypogaea]|nr:uncharacterized protein DS421_12g361290 [Arachis hypogaea]
MEAPAASRVASPSLSRRVLLKRRWRPPLLAPGHDGDARLRRNGDGEGTGSGGGATLFAKPSSLLTRMPSRQTLPLSPQFRSVTEATSRTAAVASTGQGAVAERLPTCSSRRWRQNPVAPADSPFPPFSLPAAQKEDEGKPGGCAA